MSRITSSSPAIHRTITSLVGVALIAGAASACGSTTSGASSSASSSASGAAIAPPASIKAAGTLVACSDLTYPPEEYTESNGVTPTGTDIEIAQDVANLMGVQLRVVNIPSATILAALSTGKCDVVFNTEGETAVRKESYIFVSYARVGGGLLVKAGNPSHITTDVASLAGKSIAYEQGTNYGNDIEALSKTLQQQGKPAIDLVGYPSDTAAYEALQTGRVDAFAADSVAMAYRATQSHGQFELAGPRLDVVTVGAALRKNETALQSAIQAAINKLNTDGTIKAIYTKYGVASGVQLVSS